MTPHLSSTPVFGGIINGAPATNGKIIQRISPARLSDSVKERRMTDADAELVLQSQNGSPAAFEQLVRNHQRMIHSLTFRMTGSLADAEDLAQETFIRAYAQIGTFHCSFGRSPSPVKIWCQALNGRQNYIEPARHTVPRCFSIPRCRARSF
jgi:hypothetical protein